MIPFQMNSHAQTELVQSVAISRVMPVQNNWNQNLIGTELTLFSNFIILIYVAYSLTKSVLTAIFIQYSLSTFGCIINKLQKSNLIGQWPLIISMIYPVFFQ